MGGCASSVLDCVCNCGCCSCTLCVQSRPERTNQRFDNSIEGPFKYKAEKQYDFFISYRTSCDSILAKSIYYLLNNKFFDANRDRQTTTCFLDQFCLTTGESWKEGFKKGLINASVIVILISEAALLQMKTLTEESEDNLLFEWYQALQYHSTGSKAIIPILVGKEEGNTTTKFNDFSTEKFPDIICKNTTKSVKSIISSLFQLQGTHLSIGANLDPYEKEFFDKLRLRNMNPNNDELPLEET